MVQNGEITDFQADIVVTDEADHSNEENDLMLPIVPAIPNPILTQEEVEKALQSPKAFYVN
ncbi:hypothetical protein EXW51_16460 [Bacillus mycoides]|nr:hypothetical protein EXW51_16460 [Bacillus mycoides]